MVNGAKVVSEDWEYITNEVSAVMDGTNGTEVKVVLPETSQISDDAKSKFNTKMSEFMESRGVGKAADIALSSKVTPGSAATSGKEPAKEPTEAPSHVSKVTPVSPRGLVGGALPSLPSRMEVEQSGDSAYTPKHAQSVNDDDDEKSANTVTSPQNISLNALSLDESRSAEVANTPNSAADVDTSNDMDDIPDSVPMMVTVVSETGDELLHIESPKKKVLYILYILKCLHHNGHHGQWSILAFTNVTFDMNE